MVKVLALLFASACLALGAQNPARDPAFLGQFLSSGPQFWPTNLPGLFWWGKHELDQFRQVGDIPLNLTSNNARIFLWLNAAYGGPVNLPTNSLYAHSGEGGFYRTNAGPNGQATFQARGDNLHLAADTWSLTPVTNPFSFYIVWKNGTIRRMLVDATETGARFRYALGFDQPYFGGYVPILGGQWFLGNADTTNNWMMFSAVVNGTTMPNCTTWTNGVQATSCAFTNNPAGAIMFRTLALGFDEIDNSEASDPFIFEFLIYNKQAHSTSDRQTVEAYLQRRMAGTQ